jgi:hypothetical protein
VTDQTKACLARQFDIAWQLTSHHLHDLTTDECLWRPARAGLHVVRGADGAWRGEWPTHEGYDLGPASMAWITWHMNFWWSMVLDHSFGAATLDRDHVTWPGTADGVRQRLTTLKNEWEQQLDRLTPDDLASTQRTRWPVSDRPFAEIVAWVNIELTKNASELGYARFLHAVRDRTDDSSAGSGPGRRPRD